MFNIFKRNNNKKKASIFAVRQQKKDYKLVELLASPNTVISKLKKNLQDFKNYKINNN